jgi:hypothetical protein
VGQPRKLGSQRFPGLPIRVDDRARVREPDAALEQCSGIDHEAPERQRIEHFIGNEDAGERRLGRRIEPLHARAQRRGQRTQRFGLACTQLRADLEDAVTLRQRIKLGQAQQQPGGQTPRARAEFQHLSADGLEHLRALDRQAARKQLRHFRCGHEITRRPELDAAGGIVAKARRVQHQTQVVIEGQPPGIGLDAGAHHARDRRRLLRLLGAQRRQR